MSASRSKQVMQSVSFPFHPLVISSCFVYANFCLAAGTLKRTDFSVQVENLSSRCRSVSQDGYGSTSASQSESMHFCSQARHDFASCIGITVQGERHISWHQSSVLLLSLLRPALSWPCCGPDIGCPLLLSVPSSAQVPALTYFPPEQN